MRERPAGSNWQREQRMTEPSKDSQHASKKRSDGDGSVFCRHKPGCSERGSERPRCKCPWQAVWVAGTKPNPKGGKPLLVRRKATAGTKSGATAKLNDLKERYPRHELPADGKPLTVETWMTHWYTRIVPRTAKPYTVAGYNAKVNDYIIPLLGHHRLDRLTPEHIEDAWDVLRETGNPKRPRQDEQGNPIGLSANTIHQTHRILSAALTVATRRKKLRVNPAGRESMKIPPKVDQPIEPMTEAEVDAVLAACRGKWNAARWNVALALGLRQGEALGLRWEDVDLEAGEIQVRQTLMRVTGQGIIFGTPKSDKSRRGIALPPSLHERLKTHRKEQNEKRLELGSHWTDSGLVFTLEDGRPLDPSVDAGRWRRLLEDAGVRHYRLHDARHSAATMMVNEGVDVRTAMAILGHSQLSVTMKYQHVVDETKRAAAVQLDRSGRWA